MTRVLAPGVHLHVWRTKRFTTTTCRIALHKDLGDDATATALLSRVMEAATASAPTRKALADRLSDLYGAGLHVGVEKRGDHQVLVGQLDWPTTFLAQGDEALIEGLALLREVWSEPVGVRTGALDDALVETERRNLDRTLRALPNDKSAWALRRALGHLCRGEPHAVSALGERTALADVTPQGLAALHQRLLRRAAADIYLVGDVTPARAERLVRRHLLWDRDGGKPLRLAPIASVRPARARPRSIRDVDDMNQAQLVLGWRGAVRPGTAASRAAALWSGLLGPGSYGRLFRVVREEQELCYDIGAQWNASKGYLLVRTGVAPENAARATRLISRLVKAVGAGDFPDETLENLRADLAERVRGVRDSPGAMIGWWQAQRAQGTAQSPAEHLARVLALGRADVRRVAPRVKLDVRYRLGPPDGGAA